MKHASGFTVFGFMRNVVALFSVLTLTQYSEGSTPSSTEISCMSEENPDRTSELLARQASNPKERAKMGSAPLSLTDKPVRCTLEPSPEKKEERPPTVSEVVKKLAPSRKLLLVVKDLRTNVQPGVIYSLYLDLPDGASPKVAEAHFVGSVNFFNALVTENPTKSAKSERFMSFDVTQLMKTLSSKDKLKEKPTLTIVPEGQPVSASKPLIGEISLVEQ